MLTIQQIKDTVTDYFKDKPVKSVYLFGSYARGDANEKSDVDILFALNEDAQISYFGLAKYLIDLEKVFKKKVDLVEEKLIFPKLKSYIDNDKILLHSK